jgi:hypothetical protein
MTLLTYDSAEDAEADKAQQQSLLTALNGWDRALRRDECSAWCIYGKHGRIYTWGDGSTWVLSVRCRSKQGWTIAKRRLDFCAPTQDGDDEGCLRLHRLPTADQAEVIRDILGIRKRVEYSPETLEQRRSLMAAWNGAEPRPNSPTEALPLANRISGHRDLPEEARENPPIPALPVRANSDGR